MRYNIQEKNNGVDFMEDFNLNIDKRLAELRKKKGYTLSQLEELSGVSKSMLGQIERGESNPTVKTLWKIAKSLNVSFSFFVEENKQTMSKVSKTDVTPVLEAENMYRVYPLLPYTEKRGFEIYLTEMEAGYQHNSEAHSNGVEEYVMPVDGCLEITAADKRLTAGQGEMIHFKADCEHSYYNQTDHLIKIYLILFYN